MLKFFQTTQMRDVKLPIAFYGSVALLALASATPSSAQGVPDGLRRLDPPSYNSDRFVAIDRAEIRDRNAYARDYRSRRQILAPRDLDRRVPR
jgi:hypothetical protein